MGKFYITTTLPYVNAKPHVGFAMEIVRADALARAHRATGDKVLFNTGTDEHGLKIYQKALENHQTPQEYCDEYAAKFEILRKSLNLSYDTFIRTTDKYHIESAQEFWRRCLASGDIYKAKYKIKYCVGCELEKTDSELVDGKCPVHPSRELEIIDEENYFFRWSKYQKPLLDLYKKQKNYVVPYFRQEEITKFVESGLQDFSISRLKAKMPWGVDIPDDPDQVMYVWFDALVSYIAALGWPKEKGKFEDWWPGYQVAGKDNLRPQSAMWQAMLMSAGIPNSKQIYVEGFITSGGQKMSKDFGNVIDPLEYVDRYGTDALRYFLLAKIDPFEDGDFTRELFEKAYQADLANGLGNLVARIVAMASGTEVRIKSQELRKEIIEKLDGYRFDGAMKLIWEDIKKADTFINENRVWEQKDEKKTESLEYLVNTLRQIGTDLQPFLPETAEKILKQLTGKVTRGDNLFQRLP